APRTGGWPVVRRARAVVGARGGRPLGTAAAAAAPVAAAPRIETRSSLVGIAPALLGARPDLREIEIVLGPRDRNLLADELLDGLQVERARLVDQRDGLAAGARARGAPDAMDVVLRVLR